VASFIAGEVGKLGPFDFICSGDPKQGIPAVCFKIKDGANVGYTLYDLSERLRLRGWQVPAFAMSGKASDTVVMRIMCRRGFEIDFAALFIDDLKTALDYLAKHPSVHGVAQEEGFNHT
jgi:glutamate decarboxylase